MNSRFSENKVKEERVYFTWAEDYSVPEHDIIW